jgi:hypothetical protein
MSKQPYTEEQNQRIGEWLELFLSSKIKYKTDGYIEMLKRMEDEDQIIIDTVIKTLKETKDLDYIGG